MIPVTFNGEAVYLLHYRANWQAGFVLRPNLQGDVDRSQGSIEARAPLGETLRSRLSFELQLFETEAAAFSVALQRLGGSRVLCPFWAAAHRYLGGETVYLDEHGEAYLDEEGNPYTGPGVGVPYITSGIWLIFEEDWSAWSLSLGEAEPSFTPSETAIRVPLLLGRFEQRPRPRAHTDRLLACPISFVEQSPPEYALAPMLVAPEVGPSIGGREIFTFPLSPDWSVEPEVGEVYVEREDIVLGHGREPASTCYPQAPARVLTLGYTPYTWFEIARFLSFFLQRRGQTFGFWLPCPLLACKLDTAALATATVLDVDDPELLGDNRYLVFPRAGLAPIYAGIYSVDTINRTVTLTAPLGVALPAGQPIGTAVLARFSSPEFELNFTTDQLAEVRLSFIELGSEYYTPSGEVMGLTMGASPARPHLYRFTRSYPGIQIVNRYTSHERDVILDGQVYLARNIEHDQAVDTITLDDAVAKVRAALFAGNPLALVPAGRLEAPLYCEILACEIDGAANALNPISRMYGKVSKPRVEGGIISVQVTSVLGGLDEAFPTFLLTPTCNVGLFTPPCGMVESAHAYTGALVSVVAGTITLESMVKVSGGALPTLSDGYFSYGRLWTGSGETFESRTIYSSAIVSAGRMAFVVSHPLNLTPSGPIYITPGCAGTIEECQLKFGNRTNFRGFPYIPTVNPSLIDSGGDQETGGKK